MKHLYCYKCRFCATWAHTAEDSGPYVRCNGCRGSKKFMFKQPVEGAESEAQWAYAKKWGVAYMPYPSTLMGSTGE